MHFVKNEKWYGWTDGKHVYVDPVDGLTYPMYQSTEIDCQLVSEIATAKMMFLKGQLMTYPLQTEDIDTYRNSEFCYFTPSEAVYYMILNGNLPAVQEREAAADFDQAAKDLEIITLTSFHQAMGLSFDRALYCDTNSPANGPAFGLVGSAYIYDGENGLSYRSTDAAKQVLCDVYGVDVSKYESLDDAHDSITGYNIDLARELITKAYNEALAAGDIKETDKVVLTFGSGAINETVTRRKNFLADAFAKAAVGTPLEGRIEVELKDFAAAWANDFRAGAYDVCMGGWSGAAWDPGYFLLAYLSPDYMYSKAWDTSSQMMTFTMKGVGENGEDITETMSLLDWYDCLNGSGAYDWSSNGLPEAKRLQLIAALEKEVLSVYYTVPLENSFSASMLSYQVDYISYEYNTFMSYGGIKYMTFMYDDAEWAEQVNAVNGQLNYK
jgi:ABC-type oligopeptide transport system substrate-binding subunit